MPSEGYNPDPVSSFLLRKTLQVKHDFKDIRVGVQLRRDDTEYIITVTEFKGSYVRWTDTWNVLHTTTRSDFKNWWEAPGCGFEICQPKEENFITLYEKLTNS